MDLEIGDSTYAITTGGYESAIPSDSVYELEDADYYTRSKAGKFPAEEIDLTAIYSDPFCARDPMFTVQFGRASSASEDTTFQAMGTGIRGLEAAISNIEELSYEIEEKLNAESGFSTHRPFVKAHTTLNDGSVLYTEIYYHTISADSVKHFEMVIFHPKQPFGKENYEGIFKKSPVRAPPYVEEASATTKSDFKFIGYEPSHVEKTEALQQSAVSVGCIENPLQFNRLTFDEPWRGFNTPRHFFPQLYCRENEFKQAKITAARAVSFEVVEPVFYQMELDR